MAGEMTIKQYYSQELEKKELVFRELSRLDNNEQEEYWLLLTKLKDVNNNRKKFDDQQKGKALEDIVTFIIDKSSVFKVVRNLYTSTNEIDQIIELSFKGKGFKEYIDIRGDIFLGECKNYGDKVGVTWVGKFYSLLQQNCKLGVIFSYHGLTGSGWNDGIGLTKKLFITKEDESLRTYILDFNIEDFKLIQKGSSFLEILEAKMIGLKTDTSYLQHISLHPSQY